VNSALSVSMTETHTDELSEQYLVEEARSDPEAFGLLYQRYMPRVYRYVRARTSNDDDAADLTQQIFARAFRAMPAYESRGVPFVAWLFRVAHNSIANEHRRDRSTISLDLVPDSAHPVEPSMPEDVALAHEESQEVNRLLSNLDRGKRELVLLRFAAGLTIREMAAVLGKRESAVRKQLTRTLSHLKEQRRAE